MKSIAIVLVCYNRLLGLQRLVKSLELVDYNNRKDIHLIFSIDNSGKSIIQDFADSYQWLYGEKHIRTFQKRQGLKNHILSCGEYTKQYDIVIILEDDLYVSDSLYNYAYQAADYYFDDDRIAGISLYGFQKNWLDWLIRFEPQKTKYDVYFLKIAQSWGQVWTQRKWELFMQWYNCHTCFTKSNNIPQYLNTWPESSWLKYHDRYCIETNKYFVYPYFSITTNYSDSGEHSSRTSTDHQVELIYGKSSYSFVPYSEEAVQYDEYMDRLGLGKYLGIPEEELCVDFWGTKSEQLYKKYLLTTEAKNFKIIKEFSLSLRPIELSVIQNIEGKGIFLYNTSILCNNSKYDGKYLRYLYSIRSSESDKVLRFAIKLWTKDVWQRIKRRIKRIIHL